MNDETAAQRGNKFTGSRGIIKNDAAVPQRGWDKVAETGDPAPATIPFFRGTTDIVFLLKDGQIRHFDSDPTGVIMSNYFFESFPHLVSEIHFGELCHYVRNGKVQQHPVVMTREQFFDGVKP